MAMLNSQMVKSVLRGFKDDIFQDIEWPSGAVRLQTWGRRRLWKISGSYGYGAALPQIKTDHGTSYVEICLSMLSNQSWGEFMCYCCVCVFVAFEIRRRNSTF